MSPRDLVYVGHMLDMAKKAVSKTTGLSREAYDADENLRLALIHLVQVIGEAGRRVTREFSALRTPLTRLRESRPLPPRVPRGAPARERPRHPRDHGSVVRDSLVCRRASGCAASAMELSCPMSLARRSSEPNPSMRTVPGRVVS